MAINFQTFQGASAVTPSDTADNYAEAIYVGGAGNVTVIDELGVTTTFTAPPVGSIIPIRTVKIKATLTTATLLVALR